MKKINFIVVLMILLQFMPCPIIAAASMDLSIADQKLFRKAFNVAIYNDRSFYGSKSNDELQKLIKIAKDVSADQNKLNTYNVKLKKTPCAIQKLLNSISVNAYKVIKNRELERRKAQELEEAIKMSRELLTQALYAEEYKDITFYDSRSKEALQKVFAVIKQASKDEKEITQLSTVLNMPITKIERLLDKVMLVTEQFIDKREKEQLAQKWTVRSAQRRKGLASEAESSKENSSINITKNKLVVQPFEDLKKPVFTKGLRFTTPLMKAVKNNNIKQVRKLLGMQVDINLQNNRDETALFIATRWHHAELAKLLVQAGADVNIAQKNGLTPLHQAIMAGNVELARALLNAGANVNARDSFHKRTPLLWVGRVTVGAPKKELKQISVDKSVELVDLLLYHGANPNVRDDQGKTALQWAELIGVKPLIERLQ
jgi:muconolactone delta-isomerase